MKLTEGYDLSIDTGEVDENGDPIYEQVSHLEETIASGKQLKRVANRGHTQSCNLKDDTSVDLYQNDQLLATWQIIPQYWQINHWQDYTKTKDLLDIIDGHLVASGEQGGFSWNIDIAWTSNDSKWSINVVAPGILFRFKWQIVFTTLGQELMESGVLKLGFDDYSGETLDDEGIAERNIIFEPDGVQDELIVDPYLSLTEESTYYAVTCDGFVFRVDTNTAGLQHLYDETNSTQWSWDNNIFRSGGLTYKHYTDPNRVVFLIENTPTRIIIKSVGTLYSASAHSNVDECRFTWYIYPDKVIIFIEIDADATGVAVDHYTSNGIITHINAADITNETAIYESSGSEAVGTGFQNTADYIGATADQFNFHIIVLDDITLGGSPPNIVQRNFAAGSALVGWDDGTLAQGTSSLTIGIFSDSADREDTTPTTAWVTSTEYSVGDLVVESSIGYECITGHTAGTFSTDYASGYWRQCHKYTTTDRLAIADQYHDIENNTNLPDITDSKGSLVTDMVIPRTIDAVEAMASDGADHCDLDSDDHNLKLTFNQTHINWVGVCHDPSIRTGDGTTEHLIAHYKCNDNAANTTVVDEMNRNSNNDMDMTHDVNTSTVSTTDAVRGRAIECDGAANSMLVTLPSSGVNDRANWYEGFSLSFRFKPLEDYSVGSNTGVFVIGSGWSDAISLMYGISGYSFRIGEPGNEGSTEIPTTYNSNAQFQQWHHAYIVLIDNGTDRKVHCWINGVYATRSLTSWSTEITTLQFGEDAFAGLDGNYLLDSIKLYNKPIFHFGTFLSAQHINDDDFSDAHSDILACIHSSTLEIGTGSLTLGGATTTTGPDGNSTSALAISGTDLPYISCNDEENINANKGKISFWYKETGTSSEYSRFFSTGGSSKLVHTERQSGSNSIVEFAINNNSVALDCAINFNDGNYHFMEFYWNADDNIRGMIIDGKEDTDITSFTAPTLNSNNIYIGSDVDDTSRSCEGEIYGFTILDDPNTPELPFVLGHGPIVIPKVIKG